MLTDELKMLPDLAEDVGMFRAECARIRSAWQNVVFSETGAQALARYLTYHLKGISVLSDTLFLTHPDQVDVLNGLLGFLLNSYPEYLNLNVQAPKSYVRVMQENITRLKTAFLYGVVDAKLGEVLDIYWSEISETGARYSFAALHYGERLTEALLGAPDEQAAERVLDQLNFNHLAYFNYRRQKIRCGMSPFPITERKAFLEARYLELFTVPSCRSSAYHADWPTLTEMLSAWLKEELAMLPQQTVPAAPEKLPLNLSVSQLALWIRLWQDQGLFGTDNLAEVFRFFARHYRTKRQEHISRGGLSKEYYGAGQVTAAVTRDQLRQMTDRINRDFFPA